MKIFGQFPGGRHLGDDEIKNVIDVISSRSPYRFAGLNLKHYCNKLESEMSNFVNKKHCLVVNSGTAALHCALHAIGIKKGDEVIVPAYGWSADLMTILALGATPIIAPVSSDCNLDLKRLDKCISEKTKALIVIHMRGYPCDFRDITSKFKSLNIPIIEDCAQAHLATWQSKVAGSFGDAGAYSFYPTKNLGAPGDAGMLITQTASLAERAGRLRNYGQSERYHHPELGMNSRLDEMQAAILAERLKWLHQFTERRRHTANAYRASITNPLVQQLAAPEEPTAHVYHLFVITCQQRDALQSHLQTEGVQALIHYPVPIHEQVPCKMLQRDPQGLKASENHAGDCLSLPCHPQMTEDAISTVIDAVNSFKAN